jgi:hypothetical protein
LVEGLEAGNGEQVTDYQYFAEETRDYCVICGAVIIYRNGKRITTNPECECESYEEADERFRWERGRIK